MTSVRRMEKNTPSPPISASASVSRIGIFGNQFTLGQQYVTTHTSRNRQSNSINTCSPFFLQPYIEEIFNHLRGEPFQKFLERLVRDFAFDCNRNILNLWFRGEFQIYIHCYLILFFSDKFTRFCQWKNLELNIQVSNVTMIPEHQSGYITLSLALEF